jgi:ornithine cyclodeaminase/alanine dehydrogenase-like protein (mu-crystallin family)
MPLLLTESDVRALLPMRDLIAAMERALCAYSAGHVVQPVRTVLDVAAHQAFFGVMPATLGDPPALGAKLVTVYPMNHARGLPSHLATIVLFDHATGALTGLIDGRYITEARTAAVSAVSVGLLGRPDATVLAIIGSGVQARSHLEALSHVRELREVRVWSPNAEHRSRFARDASASGYGVREAENASDAVRGADLIVLATSSKTPVLMDKDVAPGTHICAVGACRPDQREMPAALVARSRFFVDSRAGAQKEAGDLLLAINEGLVTETHVVGELGELVLGRLAGRRTGDETTIFKSLGMAVEDVVAAQLVLERAATQGRGVSFSVS